MTREELREAVVKAIHAVEMRGQRFAKYEREVADAAIALVLEEAAKVVESLPVFTFHERNVLTKGQYTTTHTCAAAIRALVQP